MNAITLGPRLIAPFVGVAISILAYFAQNVWHLFHIDDVSNAIRGLDRIGVLASFCAIGVIEATVLLCFYLPGTAIVIVLILGLQPTVADALPLAAALMAGTMAGYGLSFTIGKVMQERLPALVGPVYFEKIRTLIERYGSVSLAVCAFHPNQLAFVFAVLGYFKARRLVLYLAIALVAQAAWWTTYGFAADLIAGQKVVTSNNFQLYLAGLFLIWLVYELLAPRKPS